MFYDMSNHIRIWCISFRNFRNKLHKKQFIFHQWKFKNRKKSIESDQTICTFHWNSFDGKTIGVEFFGNFSIIVYVQFFVVHWWIFILIQFFVQASFVSTEFDCNLCFEIGTLCGILLMIQVGIVEYIFLDFIAFATILITLSLFLGYI